MFFAWFCSWELLTAMWKSIQMCFRSILTPPYRPMVTPHTPHSHCMVDFVLFTVEPVPTLDSHTPHHIQLVHTQISPIPCVSHTKQCPHMGAKWPIENQSHHNVTTPPWCFGCAQMVFKWSTLNGLHVATNAEFRLLRNQKLQVFDWGYWWYQVESN